MKVKIGKTTYDTECEPIMIILSEIDKANIASMSLKATKYCGFPLGSDEKVIREFMEMKDTETFEGVSK
jgi:hypothetical protein